MSKRVAAIIEALAFLALTFFVVKWVWTQNGWFEPYTALCGVVFGALEIYRRWFAIDEPDISRIPLQASVDTESAEERADRYRRRKELFQKIRSRLKREKNNLDQLAKDPALGKGDKYTEIYPFELIRDDLRPLASYEEDATLANSIITECERILTLPSGSRNVTELMPMLKGLDARLSQWLNEAKVWSD